MTNKDYTHVIVSDETNIGHIPGSYKVLFIKTGQGGSIYGYENKYLNLALQINERFGFSVFVSATFIDTIEAYERDMKMIEHHLETADFEIFYLGISKGGLIGLWHGADDLRIKKMLCVNAPLMINFYGKTLPALKKFGKDNLMMIYGSLDPSYKYIPFIDKWTNVEIIEGADHNLRGSSSTLFEIISNVFS